MNTNGVDKSEMKQKFKLDNSNQIMILLGDSFSTRVVLESFLVSTQSTPSYKCVVYHASLNQNLITQDTYYVLKHIIY
jgi:hypothetical protein